MDLPKVHSFIVDYFGKNGKPGLFYHNLGHTLGVYDTASYLAKQEGITGKTGVILLTAALFHDAGILTRYRDHEEASVALAKETLPGFGYYPPEIEEVSQLILKTKLPQSAETIQEMILCDADLDYLGRDDFFVHSFELQLEWIINKVKITNLREWLEIQVRFLSDHRYFTKSSQKMRNDIKQKHLGEIRRLLDQ